LLCTVSFDWLACYAQAQAALLEAKWAFLAAVIAATADAAPHNDVSSPTACGQQGRQAEQHAHRRPRPHEVTKGEMALEGATAAALLATAAAEADSAQPAALLDLLSCVRCSVLRSDIFWMPAEKLAHGHIVEAK
jgi:hypothetical protein